MIITTSALSQGFSSHVHRFEMNLTERTETEGCKMKCDVRFTPVRIWHSTSSFDVSDWMSSTHLWSISYVMFNFGTRLGVKYTSTNGGILLMHHKQHSEWNDQEKQKRSCRVIKIHIILYSHHKRWKNKLLYSHHFTTRVRSLIKKALPLQITPKHIQIITARAKRKEANWEDNIERDARRERKIEREVLLITMVHIDSAQTL